MSIAQLAIMMASLVTFEETYGPLLHRKKAAGLRESTGNQALYSASEESEPGRGVARALGKSLTRPLRLLATHPIIQVISLFSAFNYGILYLCISTFSSLWTKAYAESIATSGLNYIAFVLGELFAAGVGTSITDRIWHRLQKRANGTTTPEYRLPLILPGAILMPIGLFCYGWAAQAQTFWLVPDVGVAFVGCGLLLGSQATQAYVIDAYPDHNASAGAASRFLQGIAGFAFPLFAPKVYQKLGFGWGNSLLGFVAAALGVPAPLLLWKYGASLRAKAKSSD